MFDRQLYHDSYFLQYPVRHTAHKDKHNIYKYIQWNKRLHEHEWEKAYIVCIHNTDQNTCYHLHTFTGFICRQFSYYIFIFTSHKGNTFEHTWSLQIIVINV